MPEYQRLVSYIYLYDKGIKVKNSGFAKIECKDNILRIKMNLKGAFNNYYDQWNVYLLTEENNEMLGIYLGDMKGKGASAEFQMICSSENIGGTTKSFNDLKGLAVTSTGTKKYATFWKDTNITIENFRKYNDNVVDKNYINIENGKNNSSITDQNELLKAMSIEAKEEIRKNSEKVEKKDTIQEIKSKEPPTNKQEDTNHQDTNHQDNVENEEIVQGTNIKNDNVQKDNIQKEYIKKENIEKKELQKEELQELNLNKNWNKLLEQYNRIHPFSDKEEIQCIKIELKDLKILPKSQWILSSNSFVLHGYYNYQYLILGKINNKFILGVPGVFANKEKLVAGIFGFNDFKPAQVSEYKTGRFGYWYKYL